MKTSTVSLALATVIMAASSMAFAQGATGTPGSTPPPEANWGKRFTPGWDMMTKEERKALTAKLRKVTTYNDCKAAVDEAAQKAAERAKAKGMAEPAKPKRDGCAALPK
jgi:hypothetical protein